MWVQTLHEKIREEQRTLSSLQQTTTTTSTKPFTSLLDWNELFSAFRDPLVVPADSGAGGGPLADTDAAASSVEGNLISLLLFEVRKSIAMYFADIAEVIRVQPNAYRDELDRYILHKSAASSSSVFGCLLDALTNGVVSAGAVLRHLVTIPSVLCCMLSASSTMPENFSASGDRSTCLPQFERTVVGRLLTSSSSSKMGEEENLSSSCNVTFDPRCLVSAADAAVCVESWNVLKELLTQSPMVTAEFLRGPYFEDFIRHLVNVLSWRPAAPHASSASSSSFVTLWHATRLLTILLGDPGYGKLRTMLAESPALLAALLQVINHPSFHIRFEAYHCIKVFVAKSSKPTPIRYILWLNQTTLARFMDAFHEDLRSQVEEEQEEYTRTTAADNMEKSAAAQERQRLLGQLVRLEPISSDELAILLNPNASGNT